MALQEKLYAMYLLHLRVRGMEKRLVAAQRRHRALSLRFEQLQTQQGELNTQLKQTQAHAATLEVESKAADEKIDKLREQMNSVKNNKEYSALLIEVNTLKEAKGKAEEEALEHLSRVDELQAELATVNAELEQQQKLIEGAQAEVDKHQAEVGEELANAKQERNEAAKEFPQAVLDLFARLDESHDGEVMAAVIEDDRRRMEYSCGGCFMRIPVEHVNALMRRTADVNCCPSCGRILYIEGELRDSMTEAKSKA